MERSIANAVHSYARRELVASVLLLAIAGCAAQTAEPNGSDENASASPRVEGLRLGDRGPEVRFVHDYLKSYGYFPNDAIADQYPGFRPLLAEAPHDPEEFDEILEQGVRGLQASYRLPVTGVVDAETMALLHTPRCTQPDSFPRDDEKFVLNEQYLGSGECAIKNVGNKREITWRAEETDATRLAVFEGALNEWARATSISWRKVTSGGCLIFKPGRQMTVNDRSNPSDPTQNPIAVNKTSYDLSTRKIVRADLTVGTKDIAGNVIPYFTTTRVDPNKFNMRLIMLHEIGHTFSLGHSTHAATRTDRFVADEPVMLATSRHGDDTRFLTDDDLLAVHFKVNATRYLSLERGTGARSMDVARNGDLWEVDSARARGNDSALRCNNRTVPGWGVQVAADLTRGYHLNADGQVFRANTTGCSVLSWTVVPSPVPLGYIAANGNGILWALGKTVARNTQDRELYVFNGTQFVRFEGYGTRVAVDFLGGAYHVNQLGEMYMLDMNRSGCQRNASLPFFGSGCWTRFGTGTSWGNVRAGKNSFIWLINKSGSTPWLIDTNLTQNGVVGATPCYPAGGTCLWAWDARSFLNISGMDDVVSDGDSRVYLHEGFIPTDGGPTLSPGGISMVL